MTAPQPPLTNAELAAVSAFADQVVARGLMPSSSIEIGTIRRLEREHRAHQRDVDNLRSVLSEIRAVVDAAALHSTSMPYVQAHSKIANLLASHAIEASLFSAGTARDENAQLRAALEEACDWATPTNKRHYHSAGGFASELMPMYTRIGDRTRTERLDALRKLADIQGVADAK
jgi:hypothetical protein